MNFSRPQFKKGVALVVTLLLLSVITFLAVAFLALSRRDRQSVSLSLTQSEARFFAEAAAARAQAEIFANVAVKSNLIGAPMMVSRTYQTPAGFSPGVDGLGNVNWDYKFGGNSVFTESERLQMLTNLFFDPRLPVFVQTNANSASPRDFRFYVDLNRNGRFDTNGPSAVFDSFGLNLGNRFQVGDPEWIGVLSQPRFPHSGTNRALGRYAYVVIPAGLTLDLNHIHNGAKANIGGPGLPTDGFLRNQGVGSYELNLAGFLRELNTNYYPPFAYSYTTSSAANVGRAFQDASAILSRRQATNSSSLLSIANLYGGSANLPFNQSGIDLLSIGRPMQAGDENRPWAGSPSPNVFGDVQELLDSSKTSIPFTRDLLDAGTNRSTYDRYSFYRLLSQLGVGSAPAVQGKINLNYFNDVTRNAVAETFTNWAPAAFFRAAADTILTNSFRPGQFTEVVSNGFTTVARIPQGFSLTNIPVYPTNFYNSAVHRSLQVAANLYEATVSNRYPVVFRPVFFREGNSLRISGFVSETNTDFLAYAIRDYQTLATTAAQPIQNVLAYGQPMVIGARKYLPNLNEIALLSQVNAQRKLQLRKSQPRDQFPNETNQLFILGVTNQFAIETWYPYTNNYTPVANQLQIVGSYQTNVTLLNPNLPAGNNVIRDKFNNPIAPAANQSIIRFSTNIGAGWQAGRFILPLATTTFTLSNSVYSSIANRFTSIDPNAVSNQFERVGLNSQEFQLGINHRLQVAIVDRTANRVLDYASFDELGFTANLLETFRSISANKEFWDTNAMSGVAKQLRVARGNEDPPAGLIIVPAPGIPNQNQREVDRLRVFIGDVPSNYPADGFAPTPELKVWFDVNDSLALVSSYSANDPLVHYTTKDMTDIKTAKTRISGILKGAVDFDVNKNVSLTNAVKLTLGKLNGGGRYQPWGNPRAPGSTKVESTGLSYATDLRFIDPLIRQPDDWDFPTNKLASLGQMGRVHRGTPWQTIYFKAFEASPGVSAGTVTWTNDLQRPIETHPTNDWRLLDYFTTLPSEASALGLLSVNQSDPASWAAGLAGVVVLSNRVTGANQFTSSQNSPSSLYTPVVIEPASDPFRRIVNGVNSIRTNNAVVRNQLFTSVGQILAAPELSIQSPYLDLSQKDFAISDAAYERIPQQILSLLRVGEPRYLVYAYGQSLRPADNSIVFVPPYQNLVTNYQITGEMVTRSMLRLEGSPTNPVVVVEKFDVLPSE